LALVVPIPTIIDQLLFYVQEKYVEMFQLSEVVQHFGLSREKMVLLAMLTGSDYTDGVEGVGPVTALEILAEFPGTGWIPSWSSRPGGTASIRSNYWLISSQFCQILTNLLATFINFVFLAYCIVLKTLTGFLT